MEFVSSVLWFVVAVGVLVTVHEFGHFWVARRLGVKVLRFSIGFGRPLWQWRAGRDETEYVLAAIPLGGYVKMLDESEGEVPPADRDRAFNRQSMATRTAVVVAGPAFNFLFAVLAYWVMFLIGVTGLAPLVGQVTPGSPAAHAGLHAGQRIVRVDGHPTPAWEDAVQALMAVALDGGTARVAVTEPDGTSRTLHLALAGISVDNLTRGQIFDSLGLAPERPVVPARIGWVESGGPAQTAGLAPGDLVVAADGHAMGDWGDWVRYVRAHPGRTMDVEIERAGTRLHLRMRPVAVAEPHGGTIGHIGAGVRAPEAALDRLRVVERYGPIEAMSRAIARTWDVSALTVTMVWKMLRLQISVSNLSGPISIAQYAGVSAQVGLARFLEFLAIVSVSLGILNLMPIPVLDGGHLLYYCIELVQRRPVSEEVQSVGQRVGIAMLVGLMGIAFYNDLARLFG